MPSEEEFLAFEKQLGSAEETPSPTATPSVAPPMPTEEQFASYEQEPPSDLSDFLQAAGQGATFGFSDELMAALDVLRGKAPADTKSLGEAWRVLQKKREADYEALKERSGTLALLGELAGGFLLPVPGAAAGTAAKALGITKGLRALGTGERLASHVGTGAVMGGAAGLGTSKGTLAASLGLEKGEGVGEDVLTGMGVGGAFGGVAGSISDLAASTIDDITQSQLAKSTKAARQLEAGTREGYEGQRLKTDAMPEIDPTKPEVGAQIVERKILKEAEDEAIKAVDVQQKAKENWTRVKEQVKDKLTNRPLGEEDYENFINTSQINNIASNATINEDVLPFINQMQEAFNRQRSTGFQTMDEFISALAKKGGRSGKEDAQKYIDYLNIVKEKDSPFLSSLIEDNPQLRNKHQTIFNNIFEKRVGDYYSRFASDPRYSGAFSGLMELRKIANVTSKGSELYPIKQVMQAIDKRFVSDLENNNPISMEDIINFRQRFLDERTAQLANDLNLDQRQRNILFGEKTIDPDTGKNINVGGVFSKSEDLLNATDDAFLKANKQVSEKSQHIETLLNNSDNQLLHGVKAWDFKNDDQLRSALSREFRRIIKNINSPGEASVISGTKMREYNEALAKNAPEMVSDIQKTAARWKEELGPEASVIPSIYGVERVVDPKIGSLDPRSALSQSSVVRSAAKLGRIQGAISEKAGEVPPAVSKTVSTVLKSPFTLRGMSKKGLEEVADFLSSSKKPSVARFGENMKQSNLDNPNIQSATLHSAFQREDIRRALGLTLTSEDKEKK